jgi:hypothetical protein
MNFGNDDAPTAAPTTTAKPVQTSQSVPWEDDVSAAEESFAPTAPVATPAAANLPNLLVNVPKTFWQ